MSPKPKSSFGLIKQHGLSGLILAGVIKMNMHLATLDERVKKGEIAYDSVTNRTYSFYSQHGSIDELLAWKRDIEQKEVRKDHTIGTLP